MIFFGGWRTTFAAYFLLAVATCVVAQQPSQGPSAQQQSPATQIEAIREPGKPAKLILLYPPQSPETGLALGPNTGPSAQDGGSSSTVPDLQTTSLPPFDAAGMSTGPNVAAPFDVFQSGGGSVSPLQPPPGSAQWVLQQRLNSLKDLKQEIAEYEGARDWSALQQSIQDHKPMWLVILENPPLPDPEGPDTEGASPDNPIPQKPIMDEPPDQEQQILGRSSDSHLYSLQRAIAFDAKQLGLVIDSNGGTEQGILDRLNSEIDTEMQRAIADPLGIDVSTGQSSSNGTVIDSWLVPDSPPPANGITIETPQFVPNPSPNGIEASAPSATTSIESNLEANGEDASGGRQSTNLSSGNHSGFSLDKFLSDIMPWIEFGVQVAQTVDNARSQVRTQQPAAIRPKSNDPCANISHNTIVYAVGCTGKPVTPTQKLSGGKTPPNQPPSQGPAPPTQNCSGGICCDPPSVPNPAAVACLNTPTPGCDHPNGPESWLPFCISR